MTSTKASRTEREVFEDLRTLCTSPGYVHALADVGLKDNMIVFAGSMTPEAMAGCYGRDRTIRTEYATLLGLLLTGPIDFSPPSPEARRSLVGRTYSLLEELHACLGRPMLDAMVAGAKGSEAGIDIDPDEPFTRGDVLREAIFYGAESAYAFQYAAFAPRKYAADDPWLLEKMGFGIAEAHAVAVAVSELPGRKLAAGMRRRRTREDPGGDVLASFALSTEEVAAASGVAIETTRAVLEAFTAPKAPCNRGFASLGDFNLTSARPLLRHGDGRYLALQAYGFLEALYESPFYWMAADEAYKDAAFAHRGAFTEDFVADRMTAVFGPSNVHRGVIVLRGAKRLTDVDVLVTFADRAIVIQCKSKRLTLEARKGNDLRLRDDFKKAVQQAYDQARVSAEALGDPSLRFVLADGSEVGIVPPRVAYPVCVVSDHYPALTVQARQFLRSSTDEVIRPPLATDVFVVDVMAEMLGSPLRFLSYLDRRVGLADRIVATNELAVLGHHLSSNLWVDAEFSLAMFDDACAVDLDAAMTVRREGFPGRRTPKGFLDRFGGATPTGRMLAGIERSDDPSLVALGLLLLTMGGDASAAFDAGIAQAATRAHRDGRPRDFTMALGTGSAGVTVHCDPDPDADALERLNRHCACRKYVHRADGWFGLLVRAGDGTPLAGLELRSPWVRDDALEKASRDLVVDADVGRPTRPVPDLAARKVGRNAPCPCGSGAKHKRCCARPT